VTFVYGEVLNIMCTKEIPTLWKKKENIHHETSDISREELHRLNTNMICVHIESIWQGGQHATAYYTIIIKA
jgi:hypothetical protein